MNTLLQDALEAQLDALHITEALIYAGTADYSILDSGWQVDRALVLKSTPYVWSKEVTEAVILAGQSIPLDTDLKWNLSTDAAWWYFEKPLPYDTVFRKDHGIRALNFGWLQVSSGGRKHLAYPHSEFGMPCVCWLDNSHAQLSRFKVQPSQTWEWGKETTLGEMLRVTEVIHRKLYERGGRYADAPHVNIDTFMRATEGCARFILAALAWVQQKILVVADESVERHARKRYSKVIRPIDGIRVISLRKREYQHDPDAEYESTTHRELSCRFGVEGHWRNQAHGPGFSQRRLTWIGPYIKGPDDKPFRAPVKKVYRVDR